MRVEPILVVVLSACAATIESPAGGRGGSAAPGSGGAPDPGDLVDGASGASGSGASVGGAAGHGDNSGGGGGGSGGTTESGAAGGTAGAAGDGPADSDAGAFSVCPSLTDGWTSYQPTTTLQCEGGDSFCQYENSGGIELFKIRKNGNVRQRLEQRVHNDYRTGMNQFEGDLRVTSGDGTTVHQVFKFLMLVAYPKNGGELHQHSQTFLASHVFGTWIHVNTIHDVGSRKTDIYFDCVKKTTMDQSAPSSPGGWYDKYGVYNLGGPEAQSEWKNVRYYRK